MPKKLICLTIYHNMFLNRNQRYEIAERPDADVSVVGVSVPIWCQSKSAVLDKHLETDEPGEEIFCRYTISGGEMDSNTIITAMKDGYRVHLPTAHISRKLLDLKDGGSEGLSFTNHAHTKFNNCEYQTIHFVNIKDITELTATLSF